MNIINNEIEVNLNEANGFIAFDGFTADNIHCDIFDGDIESMIFIASRTDAYGYTIKGSALTTDELAALESRIEQVIMDDWNNQAALGDFADDDHMSYAEGLEFS